MELGTSVMVAGEMDAVIEKVTEVLKEQGFGILTRIDVDKTLKTKIDVDFRPYVILGACNPVLAHKALTARPDVGLMLPCNVTVEKSEGNAYKVIFIDPAMMMQFGDLGNDPALVEIGTEAAKKISAAAEALN